MKKFLYAVAGVAVVFSVRALERARALQEDVSDRLEDLDSRRLRRRVRVLAKYSERMPAQRLKDQASALVAAVQDLGDKGLVKQAQGLQKSAGKGNAKKLRKQAQTLAESLASARDKAREKATGKQPRRRFPIFGAVALLGLVAVGIAAARRREQLVQQVSGLQEGAQKRLPGVLGSRGGSQANEQQLRAAVESAITSAAPAIAADIRVEVEGRTVYLRGATTDRDLLERAVRQAQEVPGVAAVINLVSMTSPASSNGQPATTGTTSTTSV